MHLIVVFAILFGAAYFHPAPPLITSVLIWLALAAAYHAFEYINKKK